MQYDFLSDDDFKVRYKKTGSNLEPLTITRTSKGAKIASMSDAEFHSWKAVNALIALIDANIIVKSITL